VRIAIIAVGKIKQPGLRREIEDYLSRIRHYAKCDEIELKDGPDEQVVERFRKAIGTRAQTVALEVGGKTWTSPRFARFIGDCENSSVATLAMLVGGSYGLPPRVSNAADIQLSLSPMTLPHRVARLVLVEQVYRAFTILRNEPYSH